MEWRGDQEGRVRVSDPGGRLIYRITGRMHPVSAVLPIGTEHALIGYADGVVELVQTEPWSTRGARVLTVFYFEDELPVRIDQDPKTREIFASNRHQVLCIGRDGGAPRISPWVGWMQGWRSHGDWKVRSIR